MLALLAGGAATGRGVLRVGPGRFAMLGSRVLPPGWHLTSPFYPPEILSEKGEGAVPPLPALSHEGVRASAILSFHYKVDLPRLARASAEQHLGFHSLLEGAASSALNATLAGRSATDFLDREALDAPLTR